MCPLAREVIEHRKSESIGIYCSFVRKFHRPETPVLPWTSLMARAPIAAIFVCFALFGQQAETPNPKELFERGQQSLNAGKYAAAERDFHSLIAMGVRSASVYTNLGVVYIRTRKLDSAIQALKQAKELAPGMTGIDLNLGLAYYQQREFKQAVP